MFLKYQEAIEKILYSIPSVTFTKEKTDTTAKYIVSKDGVELGYFLANNKGVKSSCTVMLPKKMVQRGDMEVRENRQRYDFNLISLAVDNQIRILNDNAAPTTQATPPQSSDVLINKILEKISDNNIFAAIDLGFQEAIRNQDAVRFLELQDYRNALLASQPQAQSVPVTQATPDNGAGDRPKAPDEEAPWNQHFDWYEECKKRGWQVTLNDIAKNTGKALSTVNNNRTLYLAEQKE